MDHGGNLEAAIALYGGQQQDWIDLSTGLNPFPYPLPKLAADDWQNLPSNDAQSGLINAAKTIYKVPDQCGVSATPGTQALIQMLPQLCNRNLVSILSPTYNEYEKVWRQHPAKVSLCNSLSEACNSDVIVAVNPNNPTGQVQNLDDLLKTARKLHERNGLLVVDEAFCDVAPEISIIPHMAGLPILVLRSFGKFFGLGGLRLGFGIGSREVARQIEARLGPWAISGPAIQIGRAALTDNDWIEQTRLRLNAASEKLDKILAASGLNVEGGTKLFRYVSTTDADALHKRLAQNYIWARKFSWTKSHLRLGIPGTPNAFSRLQSALLDEG